MVLSNTLGHSIRKKNNHRTVRPAFNLNLNSVLFASAAVGGKPDGGLTPISEYSGNRVEADAEGQQPRASFRNEQ